MLNKLLKYDIKSMGKQLFICYIAIIVFAIATKLLTMLSAKWSIFSAVAFPIQAIFYVIMIGSFFCTFFVSIKRFYLNIYKDEGYLTNTLPVSKSNILLSKILSATLYFILNVAIVLFALWIGTDIISLFTPIINEILTQINFPSTLAIILFAVLMALSYLVSLFMFYVAIALGHAQYKDKMANSVLAGVIIYIGTQFLSIFLLIPFFITNKEMFFDPNIMPDPSSMPILIISTMIFSVVCIIIYYYLTNKMLNKKFNID